MYFKLHIKGKELESGDLLHADQVLNKCIGNRGNTGLKRLINHWIINSTQKFLYFEGRCIERV